MAKNLEGFDDVVCDHARYFHKFFQKNRSNISILAIELCATHEGVNIYLKENLNIEILEEDYQSGWSGFLFSHSGRCLCIVLFE